MTLLETVSSMCCGAVSVLISFWDAMKIVCDGQFAKTAQVNCDSHKAIWDTFFLKSFVEFFCNTAQKMKISINDFFNKCDQICSFPRIWSHLLKKSLMENFVFCAVLFVYSLIWNVYFGLKLPILASLVYRQQY